MITVKQTPALNNVGQHSSTDTSWRGEVPRGRCIGPQKPSLAPSALVSPQSLSFRSNSSSCTVLGAAHVSFIFWAAVEEAVMHTPHCAALGSGQHGSHPEEGSAAPQIPAMLLSGDV